MTQERHGVMKKSTYSTQFGENQNKTKSLAI